MLRELSTVLIEMQQALAPFTAGALAAGAVRADAGAGASGGDTRIRLRDATLELPLDLRVVFADGGARLDADVPRSLADSNWRDGTSRLRLRIVALAATDDEEFAS